MKEYLLSGINQYVYYYKNPQGLDVYLVPNEKVTSFYITLNVNYGSIQTEFKFKNDKKYKKVPNGIAHFLEHCMFYMPDETAHEHFANLGSQINAATSFRLTYYEVLANSKFKENLEYLLKYVYTPYFTEKMIKAEIGIISEEIKMGKDNPGSYMFHKTNSMLFKNDNMKNSIAGEIEDIKKIKLKNIKDCYNTFYQPENMFLIITGNFNKNEAIAIVNESMKNIKIKKFQKPLVKRVKEPIKVVKKYDKNIMNVSMPLIKISFKIPYKNFQNLNMSDYSLGAYLNLILEYLFGSSSDLYENLTTNNILNIPIDYDSFIKKEHDYIIINIIGETNYKEEFKKHIFKALSKIIIPEEFIERRKRVLISSYIINSDNIQAVNILLQQNLLIDGKIKTNIYNTIKELNIDELNEVISYLKLDEYCILEISSKNN